VNPTHFANTVINSPSGQAAIKHRLRGINSTISAGLASGLYALHYATEFLRLGRASALLAGGVEELCSESYLGFQKNGWLSASGQLRPFEPDSDGTLLGEGSVLCTLETRSRAEERGARFLVEVCGFGAAHDAHDLISYRKEGTGAVRAIEEALQYSGISAESISMIISGANGHRSGDKMEAEALRRVFGKQLDQIPVCAPKAALGESLGASGALLAISAALALSRQEIPPTALFSGAEVELKLSGKPQAVSGEYALITSCSCDGNNTALVLRKVAE
jgi:3-oxoacyl-[acyl-carrier-protein] synthase II